MNPITHHIEHASALHVFSVNVGVLGAVSLVEAEAVLKCAVLFATLCLTLLSCVLKWRNRDKSNE